MFFFLCCGWVVQIPVETNKRCADELPFVLVTDAMQRNQSVARSSRGRIPFLTFAIIADLITISTGYLTLNLSVCLNISLHFGRLQDSSPTYIIPPRQLRGTYPSGRHGSFRRRASTTPTRTFEVRAHTLTRKIGSRFTKLIVSGSPRA